MESVKRVRKKKMGRTQRYGPNKINPHCSYAPIPKLDVFREFQLQVVSSLDQLASSSARYHTRNLCQEDQTAAVLLITLSWDTYEVDDTALIASFNNRTSGCGQIQIQKFDSFIALLKGVTSGRFEAREQSFEWRRILYNFNRGKRDSRFS
jgi:hypothetical protein